jgi:hypothetical protein
VGRDTGQGETQVREQRDPAPAGAGEALVPYEQVYYTYLDAASHAMDQRSIPGGMRDFVRSYFTSLEPSGE